MKRRIRDRHYRLIAIILTALCMVACSGNRVGFETVCLTDSVQLETTGEMMTGKIPSCYYDCCFTFARQNGTDDTVATKINMVLAERILNVKNAYAEEALQQACQRFVEDYKGDVAPFYLSEFANKPNGKSVKEARWYSYEMRLKTGVTYSHDGEIANYRSEETTYRGGAHEYNYETWLTFNTATGDLMALEDLIATNKLRITDADGQTGQTTPDLALIKKLLLDKLLARYDVSTLEGLEEKGVLRWAEIYIPANFMITDEGIRFLYNPYEIAPWSHGKIILEINQLRVEL